MIVRRIRYGQVLRLVQQVISLERQRALVLEQEFGNLEIEYILVILLGLISLVPVIVELAHETETARDCPVHRH